MNNKRIGKEFIENWQWKVIFSLILSFVIIAFSITIAWQVDIMKRIVASKRIDDLYSIRINEIPEYFEAKVEDNKNLGLEVQQTVNSFWQEMFSIEGKLGHRSATMGIELPSRYIDMTVLLGKYYKLSNYEVDQSKLPIVLMSQDITEEERNYLEQYMFRGANFEYLPADFYIYGFTGGIYNRVNQGEVYVISNNYMHWRNSNFINGVSVWHNMLSDGMTDELKASLETYAWDINGGLAWMDTYENYYFTRDGENLHSKFIALIFFISSIVTMLALLFFTINRFISNKVDYVVYRQNGASRIENKISILAYTLGYIITPFIFTFLYYFYFEYKFKEQEHIGLHQSIYITSLVILVFVFFLTIAFAVHKEKEFEKGFSESRRIADD